MGSPAESDEYSSHSSSEKEAVQPKQTLKKYFFQRIFTKKTEIKKSLDSDYIPTSISNGENVTRGSQQAQIIGQNLIIENLETGEKHQIGVPFNARATLSPNGHKVLYKDGTLIFLFDIEPFQELCHVPVECDDSQFLDMSVKGNKISIQSLADQGTACIERGFIIDINLRREIKGFFRIGRPCTPEDQLLLTRLQEARNQNEKLMLNKNELERLNNYFKKYPRMRRCIKSWISATPE